MTDLTGGADVIRIEAPHFVVDDWGCVIRAEPAMRLCTGRPRHQAGKEGDADPLFRQGGSI